MKKKFTTPEKVSQLQKHLKKKKEFLQREKTSHIKKEIFIHS